MSDQKQYLTTFGLTNDEATDLQKHIDTTSRNMAEEKRLNPENLAKVLEAAIKGIKPLYMGLNDEHER